MRRASYTRAFRANHGTATVYLLMYIHMRVLTLSRVRDHGSVQFSDFVTVHFCSSEGHIEGIRRTNTDRDKIGVRFFFRNKLIKKG